MKLDPIPVVLMQTNHGVDGWDTETWPVANFSTHKKAKEYLAARGYTFSDGSVFAHQDKDQRQTTYKIIDNPDY